MQLIELLERLPVKKIIGDPEVEIRGLAYHSREVREGFLFAAIRGGRQDGKGFVPEAVRRGARALLVDEVAAGEAATQVVVPDVREALARLAAVFYGEPSAAMTLIGITGTNGKTTTTYLIESILQAGGLACGVMGTVNYRYAGKSLPAPNTTPESLDLQKNLAAMRQAGVTHAVLEVSSHALDLQRVRGCDFDVAVFTNLTRDHLDYHGTMEAYFEAKRLLFTRALRESRKARTFAVVNVDDPKGKELGEASSGTRFRYGVVEQAEVRPERLQEEPHGLKLAVRTPRGLLELTSPLIGRHNIYNILAAVSVGEVLGLAPGAIAAGIRNLARIPGRLEDVPGGEGIRVFVDYAHTGDALERALESLGRVRSGRLIVVFGCGGDRDKGKRPVMGRIAALGSDLAVVTSDNPRREDPLRILAEVESGVRETGRKKIQAAELEGDWQGSGYLVIPDRREAIRLAVAAARPGDAVLIAGKGHEDYQILGETKIHFDDREEAALALALKEKSHR